MDTQTELRKWLSQHKGSWVARGPECSNRVETPTPIVGEEDANTEWKQRNKPHVVFARIESFGDLQKEDTLFLFGRRGTGKTALFRMYHHQISPEDQEDGRDAKSEKSKPGPVAYTDESGHLFRLKPVSSWSVATQRCPLLMVTALRSVNRSVQSNLKV